MIVGVGVDLTSIPRIQQSLSRWGERLLRRCFTRGEREYCQRRKHPHVHFAARFAAKEACAKALGTGMARGIHWKEIEVTREPGEAPRIVLHGRAKGFAAQRAISNIQLSLSHDGGLAIAFVVVESDPRSGNGQKKKAR